MHHVEYYTSTHIIHYILQYQLFHIGWEIFKSTLTRLEVLCLGDPLEFFQVGQHVLVTPSLVALGCPSVVVMATALGHHQPIDKGATTQATAHVHADLCREQDFFHRSIICRN